MKRIVAGIVLCVGLSMLQACCGTETQDGSGKSVPVAFANWSTVTSMEIGTATLAATADGDYLYVTDSLNGLSVVNAADLGSITLLDKVVPAEQQIGPNYSAFDSFYNIRVSGNIACMAVNPACLGWCQGDRAELRFFDVADRAQPVKLATLDLSSNDLVLEGSYLYVSGINKSSGQAELTVVDLSVPNTPRIVGSVRLNGAGKLLKQGTTILVSLIDASLSSVSNFTNIQVVDVSNPALPVLAGTPSSWSPYNVTYSPLVAAGAYAYVSGAYATGLNILDIADPLHVAWLGSTAETDSIHSMVVSGSYLYTACGTQGVKVYDVTAPRSPRLVKTLPAATPALLVAVSNGTGYYVVDAETDAGGNRVGSQKLYVFSISQTE